MTMPLPVEILSFEKVLQDYNYRSANISEQKGVHDLGRVAVDKSREPHQIEGL